MTKLLAQLFGGLYWGVGLPILVFLAYAKRDAKFVLPGLLFLAGGAVFAYIVHKLHKKEPKTS